MTWCGGWKRSKCSGNAKHRHTDAGAGLAVSISNGNDRLKATLAVAEALEPWLGVGVLAESGLERSAQLLKAREAAASLSEAQTSYFSAQRYLAQKRAKVDAQIEALREAGR
jgi:hypothetical protein